MRFADLVRLLLLGVLVGLVGTGPLPVARAQDGSSGTVTTQFVFLVDDSASMKGAGGKPNDPDRLAVFAVRAMLTMLDDQDEASVLSLNAQGATPALAPLSQTRQDLYGLLAEDATIASYDVGSTPCAPALDRVWDVLEAGKRPGVKQVLFFLTDGQCSGGVVPTARWQERQAGGDFDFYYLRFSERESSRELADLAGSGNTTLLSSADAGAMIEPLAKALARSQGYSAYVIDPNTKGAVPAFRGSERVRVLVTGEDAGADLDLRVFKSGTTPQALRPDGSKGGFHYGGDGKDHQAYRYAFATFADEGSPTTYQVLGAAQNRWKGVVVPEYRLTVSIKTHEGKCDDGGAAVESLRAGSSACFRVAARDGKGNDVSKDLQAAGARVKFEWTRDGDNRDVVASSRPDAWTLEKQALPDGVYNVRPLLFITGREDVPAVRGFPISLSVSDQTITMVPAEVDAGEVHLGGVPYTTRVKLGGTFPATSLAVAYDDKVPPPSCVRVRVDGQDLPATLKGEAATGRELEVEVAVHTWCGAVALPTQEFPLRFDFGSRQTKSVRVKLSPRGTLTLPGDITLEIEAGAESVRFPATITTADVAAGASFPMMFAWSPDQAQWPQNGLKISFMNDEGQVTSNEGSVTESARLDVTAGTTAVPVYASATACCSSGTYDGVLTIVSADPPKGVKPSTHAVKVRIVVNPAEAGIWACIGDRVLKGLGILGILVAVGYLWNIWNQSKFLPNAQVMSQRIQVLYYTMDGGTPSADVSPATTGQIKGAFRNAMGFGKRFSTWMKANPLRAGLPSFMGGRPYYETLCFTLSGLAGADQRTAGLKGMYVRPELDMPARIKEAGADGFFIVARGGRSVSYFVCVRERDNPIKVTACSPAILAGTQIRLFNPSSGSQIIPGRPTPRKGQTAGIRIA